MNLVPSLLSTPAKLQIEYADPSPIDYTDAMAQAFLKPKPSGMSWDEFVDKAKSHPNHQGKPYEYIDWYKDGSHYMARINCKKHGIFTRRFYNVWKAGEGCSGCALESRKGKRGPHDTAATYFAKVTKVHNGTCNYTNSVFRGNNKEITFSCNVCGKETTRKASLHKRCRGGCIHCAAGTKNATVKLVKAVVAKVQPETPSVVTDVATSKFIYELKKVHDDKTYGYDKFKFVDAHTECTVLCKNCKKDFAILPYIHLDGFGCQRCAKEKNLPLPPTTAQVIEKAKKVHGDKCLYDKTVYLGSAMPFIVGCAQGHSDFKTNYRLHVDEQIGCATCRVNQEVPVQKPVEVAVVVPKAIVPQVKVEPRMTRSGGEYVLRNLNELLLENAKQKDKIQGLINFTKASLQL